MVFFDSLLFFGLPLGKLRGDLCALGLFWSHQHYFWALI